MHTHIPLLFYCLGLFCCLHSSVEAQIAIKSKKILKTYISATDTLLRAQVYSEYDPEGRLLRQQDYQYNVNTPGVLTKEERIQYLPAQQVLKQTILTYINGQAPRQERYETKYWVYAPDPADHKRIWKRHYDAFGELTREDTLTYNADSLLTGSCAYNYMGSTSLLCDEYTYQDTLRKRWRMWSKWTTINAKSEVVERRSKRRDYRYRYNRSGQLVRVRGIDYSSKINRWLCYDRQGRLAGDRLVTQRKVTRHPAGPDGKPDKSKKAKKYTLTQTTCKQYDQGNLVRWAQFKDGQLLRHQTYVYQDGLLLQHNHYRSDSTLTERQTYTYNAQQILTSSLHARFHPDGRERFRVVTTYNEAGKPVLQEQYAEERRLVQRRWTYSPTGLLLSEILDRNSKRDQAIEATFYTYTFHQSR